MVPDVARHSPFLLNREQDEQSTLWLLTKQVSEELEISRDRPDILLCDRGIPDILAHLEEARSRGAAGIRPDLLKPFLLEWCKTYELVFVSRINSRISPLPDDLRVSDANFRAEMEVFSVSVLAQFAPHARTLAVDLETRLREALGFIEECLREVGQPNAPGP